MLSPLTGNAGWLVRIWFMLPMAEFATQADLLRDLQRRRHGLVCVCVSWGISGRCPKVSSERREVES